MIDIQHKINLVTPGLNFLEGHGEGAKSVIQETKKILTQAADRIEALEAALLEADQFITNGIELGYIRMPDADVPDAAHHIPGNIRSVLAGEKRDE